MKGHLILHFLTNIQKRQIWRCVVFVGKGVKTVLCCIPERKLNQSRQTNAVEQKVRCLPRRFGARLLQREIRQYGLFLSTVLE